MTLIDRIFPEMPATGDTQESLFSTKRLGTLLIALLQLMGIMYIFTRFNIEKNSGFATIKLVIVAAFVLTQLVAKRFRPAILFAVSVFVIYHAFGLFSGTVLMVGGLGLIACCHLPIKFNYRVALVVLAGIGMLILRANLFYAPRASVIVPFLASMFMFRIIIYLYELKYALIPATPWQRLSYFFLFPNHCFLLFPIIDYKAFLKTYYTRPSNELWQKGIRWMLRGVIHLLCYRIMYVYLLIGPAEVHNLPTLLQYMVCSYALILRLSGLFHFIVGLLCLFGFDLHPVFDNYLLATSFVDLWRRINVYWREFIMKIFYFPVLFRLKKRLKPMPLLACTMMIVFVATWAMHNYQWFWLRGRFPLNAMDIFFWTVLGICITVNAIIIERNQEKPVKAPLARGIQYPLNVIKMIALFLFMSIMWSLWGSSSVSEWLFLVSRGSECTGTELAMVIGIIVGVVALGTIAQYIVAMPGLKQKLALPPHRTLFVTLPAIILLTILVLKPVKAKLPLALSDFMSSIADERLNAKDNQANERGYYKALIDGEGDTQRDIWEVNLTRPNRFRALDKVYKQTGGVLTRVYLPNKKVAVDNYVLETDSLGLRDKEYSTVKPPSTYRIALMGGSYEAGAGVSNNEIFEAIVEDKLNKENKDSIHRHFEIMNFAVPGYHLVQHVEVIKNRVFEFDPDVVIYVAHSGEHLRLDNFMTDMITRGSDFKYPFIKEIKRLSGVKQTMSEVEIHERLAPFMDAVILWSYLEIANTAREHHAIPVWVYLPATADGPNDAEYNQIQSFAQRVGFVTIDLRGVYKNVKQSSIALSDVDSHPNAAGHKMIADKFYEELVKHWGEIVK